MNRLLLSLLLLLLGTATAGASQQGVIAMRNWKAMDECARQAHIAFPDFTADSNARREAALKTCLEGQNLPPRAPLSPPQ